MTNPVLAEEQPDGSRRYRHPITGELAPSVTTIIAMLAKPKLTGWAAGMAAAYAVSEWDSLTEMLPAGRVQVIKEAHERYRDKSAELGTAVHAAIEAWIKGEPHSPEKAVEPYMNSFTNFMMDKRPEFIASEVTIWSRMWDYAGTADAIARIGELNWLIDYKTGKSLHDEVGLQLSALAHGDFIITPEGKELPMPEIYGLAAVHIRPRSWKFTPVGRDRENFAAFLAARELFRWSQETAPYVLGGV